MLLGVILSFFVAALGGVVLAQQRRRDRARMKRLQARVDDMRGKLGAAEARLETQRLAQTSNERAWSRIADALQLAGARRELLHRLTVLLPQLQVPGDCAAFLLDDSCQFALRGQARDITTFVGAIAEPRLTEMWETCSYQSLHAMQEELTRTPLAARAAGTGAGGLRVYFDGLELKKHFSEMRALHA